MFASPEPQRFDRDIRSRIRAESCQLPAPDHRDIHVHYCHHIIGTIILRRGCPGCRYVALVAAVLAGILRRQRARDDFIRRCGVLGRKDLCTCDRCGYGRFVRYPFEEPGSHADIAGGAVAFQPACQRRVVRSSTSNVLRVSCGTEDKCSYEKMHAGTTTVLDECTALDSSSSLQLLMTRPFWGHAAMLGNDMAVTKYHHSQHSLWLRILASF